MAAACDSAADLPRVTRRRRIHSCDERKVRSCTLRIILWQLFVAVEILLLPSRWRSCTGDKPVKLTVELSASVHRNLLAYEEVLARETGQDAEPVKLIEPMLAWFMATDRVFAKIRRAAQARSTASG